MKVYFGYQDLPIFRNAVITVGSFDGVHKGHQKLLAALCTEATKIDGTSVVITFHPHPRKIVGESDDMIILNTLEEKLALLAAQKIDVVVVIPFDDSFSNLSPIAYINDFLYAYFRPKIILVGFDHRFGKNRAGNIALLNTHAEKLGFKVVVIAQKLIAEIGVSSTLIRKFLLHQNPKNAAELLGYNYFFEGKIIVGNQLGRKIGYPTANIEVLDREKLIPADGVYAVSLQLNDDKPARVLKGMLYIGSRHVLNGKRRVIEVNIFEFAEMIYDRNIVVFFHQFIRQAIHFENFEALKSQLAEDKAAAKSALDTVFLSE